MLINLILSELAIAMFGIPPDLYNSITRGEALGSFFCPSFGFVHTFFGNYLIQNQYVLLRSGIRFIIEIDIYLICKFFEGLNLMCTITALAIIRYLSVVRLQRTWHSITVNKYWSSKYIWMVWLFAFIFAAPPLFGIGQYEEDVSKLA